MKINQIIQEAGTGLEIDRSIPGRTIARISGDVAYRTGSPSGKKLPDHHPDDDYTPWSGKVGASIHDDEEDTFDVDYMGDDGELKEFVTPQATAQDPALEREKDVDVIFYGQMPRDFTADTVAEALEEVLPREYPPGSSNTTNSNVYRVVTEIAKHQGAVVTTKPLSTAQKLVKTFQTYGIKCRIDAPGLEEDLSRRGFLKGAGAAAVAAMIPTGSKAEYSSYSLTDEDAQVILTACGIVYFGMYNKIRNKGVVAMTESVLADLKRIANPVFNKFIDDIWIMETFDKMRVNRPEQYEAIYRMATDSEAPTRLLNMLQRIKDRYINGMSPQDKAKFADEMGRTHRIMSLPRESVDQGVAEDTSRLPQPEDFASDNDYYDALDAYGQPPANDYEPMGSEDEPDDWFDESKEKVGNMDADAFDDALARLKKLAGAGPLRTVYDPTKRVYKNVPQAVQPAQQPRKAK